MKEEKCSRPDKKTYVQDQKEYVQVSYSHRFWYHITDQWIHDAENRNEESVILEFQRHKVVVVIRRVRHGYHYVPEVSDVVSLIVKSNAA